MLLYLSQLFLATGQKNCWILYYYFMLLPSSETEVMGFKQQRAFSSSFPPSVSFLSRSHFVLLVIFSLSSSLLLLFLGAWPVVLRRGGEGRWEQVERLKMLIQPKWRLTDSFYNEHRQSKESNLHVEVGGSVHYIGWIQQTGRHRKECDRKLGALQFPVNWLGGERLMSTLTFNHWH